MTPYEFHIHNLRKDRVYIRFRNKIYTYVSWDAAFEDVKLIMKKYPKEFWIQTWNCYDFEYKELKWKGVK